MIAQLKFQKHDRGSVDFYSRRLVFAFLHSDPAQMARPVVFAILLFFTFISKQLEPNSQYAILMKGILFILINKIRVERLFKRKKAANFS